MNILIELDLIIQVPPFSSAFNSCSDETIFLLCLVVYLVCFTLWGKSEVAYSVYLASGMVKFCVAQRVSKNTEEKELGGRGQKAGEANGWEQAGVKELKT